MKEPTVCAIMLTRDRPELAKKAVECFRAQTYQNKRLLIWDTGEWPQSTMDIWEDEAITHILSSPRKLTVGALRNEAAAFWTEYPILVHFDDDDYSHPNRIAEQVALLQTSRADVVGYNEMLFWRTPVPVTGHPEAVQLGGEAWLFTRHQSSYAVGASLCYWRSFWERNQFPDQPRPGNMGGEDWAFIQRAHVHAVSSLCGPPPDSDYDTPRMIQRIHGSNTSKAYEELKEPSWKRVSEWDERVRGILG